MNSIDKFQLIDNIIDSTIIVDNMLSSWNYNKMNIDTMVKTEIEEYTGVTLYNKENLLQEIENLESKDLNSISKIIRKNMIVQITFEKIFKSNLELSLIFDKTYPIIIYKNKRVKLEDMQYIKKDLLETKLDSMPKNNKLFLDTLICILEYIIKKDSILTYYCIMIPMPWLSLLKINFTKNDSYNNKYIDDIINGKHYIVSDPLNKDIINKIEEESDDILNILNMISKYENTYKSDNKDIDDMYRMEVISYLNDNEVSIFLDKLEDYDKFTNLNLNEIDMIKKLLDLSTFSSNKIIKFYFFNKLFKYIITIEKFISQNNNFRDTVLSKINSITEDMYIIESAGLSLSNDLINTLMQTREFITTISQKN